jgi:hypothetical protein
MLYGLYGLYGLHGLYGLYGLFRCPGRGKPPQAAS